MAVAADGYVQVDAALVEAARIKDCRVLMSGGMLRHLQGLVNVGTADERVRCVLIVVEHLIFVAHKIKAHQPTVFRTRMIEGAFVAEFSPGHKLIRLSLADEWGDDEDA